MKIEKLHFERKEIEIKEVYVDADGKVKERIRKVFVPTGKCLDDKPQIENSIIDECTK